MIAAVLIYRTLKWGNWVHFVPYAFSLLGLLCFLNSSQSKDPFLASAVMVGVTIVIHLAVVVDMRRDRREE